MSMNTYLPLIAVALAAIFSGIGWFGHRILTSQKATEEIALANKFFELIQNIKKQGYNEVEAFEMLSEFSKSSKNRSLMAIVEKLNPSNLLGDVQEDNEPLIFGTTLAMGARARAELDVINAKIEQAWLDLEIISGANSNEQSTYNDDHLRKLKRAWRVYRARAGDSAAMDYAGGSIAGLISLAEEIRLSEQFLDDVNSRIESLKL